MFDISFTEIILIGTVSLVVLGPEKLPGAVRTAALWIGRVKRSFNTIKNEIEKEVGADEIRRQLRNEEIMERFKHTQSQVTNTINSVKDGAETFRKNVELEAQAAAGVSSPSTKGSESAGTPGNAESTTSAEQATLSSTTQHTDTSTTETSTTNASTTAEPTKSATSEANNASVTPSQAPASKTDSATS